MNQDHAAHVAATYHEVDPASGFLQTTGNYAEAFTPERKENFLSVYKASGLRFLSTCKQLGLSNHTLNHHISIDPEFKAKFQKVQEEYAEELEAKQRAFALDQKNFMDRAMQLRALLPGKYARDERINAQPTVQININGNLMIDTKSRDESIETRIVKELGMESDNVPQGSIGNEAANNNNVSNGK